MNTVSEGDSASDISSNSSWTVLDEDSSFENFHQQTNQPTEIEDLTGSSSDECLIIEENDLKGGEEEDKRSQIEEKKEKAKDEDEPTFHENENDGFLTLDEYVAERAIEHDYEYDEKAFAFDEMMHKNSKEEKKKYRRCKAKTFGALSIMGAVLSVAGISLLCLLTPHTAISSNKISENIKTNFTKVAENCCAAGKYEMFLDGSNEALRLIDRYNIFHQCMNQKSNCMKNDAGESYSCPCEEHEEIMYPPLFEIVEENMKSNLDCCNVKTNVETTSKVEREEKIKKLDTKDDNIIDVDKYFEEKDKKLVAESNENDSNKQNLKKKSNVTKQGSDKKNKIQLEKENQLENQELMNKETQMNKKAVGSKEINLDKELFINKEVLMKSGNIIENKKSNEKTAKINLDKKSQTKGQREKNIQKQENNKMQEKKLATEARNQLKKEREKRETTYLKDKMKQISETKFFTKDSQKKSQIKDKQENTQKKSSKKCNKEEDKKKISSNSKQNFLFEINDAKYLYPLTFDDYVKTNELENTKTSLANQEQLKLTQENSISPKTKDYTEILDITEKSKSNQEEITCARTALYQKAESETNEKDWQVSKKIPKDGILKKKEKTISKEERKKPIATSKAIHKKKTLENPKEYPNYIFTEKYIRKLLGEPSKGHLDERTKKEYTEVLTELLEDRTTQNVILNILQDLLLLRLTAKVSGRIKSVQRKIEIAKKSKKLQENTTSISIRDEVKEQDEVKDLIDVNKIVNVKNTPKLKEFDKMNEIARIKEAAGRIESAKLKESTEIKEPIEIKQMSSKEVLFKELPFNKSCSKLTLHEKQQQEEKLEAPLRKKRIINRDLLRKITNFKLREIAENSKLQNVASNSKFQEKNLGISNQENINKQEKDKQEEHIAKEESITDNHNKGRSTNQEKFTKTKRQERVESPKFQDTNASSKFIKKSANLNDVHAQKQQVTKSIALPPPEVKQKSFKLKILQKETFDHSHLDLKRKRSISEISKNEILREDSPLRIELQNKQNSLKKIMFLEEIQKHRQRRAEILEQMRLEKQEMIANMVKESKRLKDTGSGYYEVELPSSDEVKRKLQELRKKEDITFNMLAERFIDKFMKKREKEDEGNAKFKLTSKSTTSALKTPATTSSELKLKRASTLTCIKKATTSNSNTGLMRLQRLNELEENEKNKEDALKLENDRKQERHEQLKKYWKTRQKYMEKRIEICDMLKKRILCKIEGKDENTCKDADKCVEKGVQILDRIITDVMSSVSLKKYEEKKAKDEISTSAEEAVKKEDMRLVARGHFGPVTIRDTMDAKTKSFYEWFFGKKGGVIFEEDRKKWFEREQSRAYLRDKELSKQDPRKSYKDKFLLNKKI